MADERYSGEIMVRVMNLTTGAEESLELKRVGDMSRAGLAQWIGVVAPIGPAIDKLNASFLADDLALTPAS